MWQTFISGFKPQSTKEWVLIGLVAVLVITLCLFYKALMNCKTTIESYVAEQRNFRKYYNMANGFTSYCQKFEPETIKDYCENSGFSEAQFEFDLKQFGDEDARILQHAYRQ